jgi:hypothetical protein
LQHWKLPAKAFGLIGPLPDRPSFLGLTSGLTKPINNTGLANVVGGHLHPDAISSGQTDKPFSHFSRDVRQYDLLIDNLNPKHRSGQHGDYFSFNRD